MLFNSFSYAICRFSYIALNPAGYAAGSAGRLYFITVPVLFRIRVRIMAGTTVTVMAGAATGSKMPADYNNQKIEGERFIC